MRALLTSIALSLFVGTGCTNAAPQATTRPHAVTAADHVPADAVVHAGGADDDATAMPASEAKSDEKVQDKPKDAAAQFDEALLRVAQGEPAEPLVSLPAEERDLITSVTAALVDFRHSLAQQGALMSSKTAPLVALSDQLRAAAPLSIPKLALCRSVTQFGVYDPIEPARLPAGKETPVIIYCELDNFRSLAGSDGRWETRLSYEAVLYTEGDNAISVINKKPTSIVDLCRNHRRDFFLADRMTLPGTLPVGKYLLKVTVVDQIANHVAEKTVPLLIAPN